MERVLVIGSPGAGKSTFAPSLARLTGLPLIHLDQEHWLPGWVERDKAEWAERVRELATRPRWIMDGNFGATLLPRLARADTVIWLDFPAWLCVVRIVRRVLQSRGKVRPDMAEGCPERFDWEFLLYTARFPWTGRKRILAKLPAFTGTLVRFRRPREAARFLAGLE